MRPQINISGPDGNAYALMGYVRRFGKQLGMPKSRIDGIIEDMTSGDYDHLVEVFVENFEDYVDVVGY